MYNTENVLFHESLLYNCRNIVIETESVLHYTLLYMYTLCSYREVHGRAMYVQTLFMYPVAKRNRLHACMQNSMSITLHGKQAA